MTLEERRARILKLRLDLINEYLVLEFIESNTGKSFAEFLKWKGITRKEFIKDLPESLKNPPAGGKKELIAYGASMNQLFVNQHLISMENEENDSLENEQAAISQKYLKKGDVDPDYLAGDVGLSYNCDGCNLKKYHNADGQCEGCPANYDEVEEYESPGSDEPDSFLNAGGSCGLPPIPPPFPKIKAIKKSVEAWDKFNARKKAYLECIKKSKAVQAISGYIGQDNKQKSLAAHLLHLSNPMEAMGRKAFLDLVSNNIFGMASSFDAMRSYSNQEHWTKLENFWYNFGGDPKKLSAAADKGKGKKPIFKPKGWKPKYAMADGYYLYDGGAGEVAGVIVAAAAIISAIVPIVKAFKKDKGVPLNEGDQALGTFQNGPPVDPTDPSGGTPETTLSNLSTNMKLLIGIPLALTAIGLIAWGISGSTKSK